MFEDLIPKAPTAQAAPTAPKAALAFDDLIPKAQDGATFDDRFSALGDEAAFRAVKPAEKSFGLGDTWPAKLAKSIYSAVTLPGDVAQGNVSMTGEDGRTNPEVINRSFDLAGVATPTSVANRAAPMVAVEQAAAPRKTPTIEELKAAASAGYKSPEVEGLSIKSPAISNFGKTTEVALNEAGIDANLAPKTFGILQNLQKVPEESFVTGKNINSIRRIFANAASSPDPTERMAAKTVMESLDNFLPNVAKDDVIAGDIGAAAKTLEMARGNYSAAKHAETIDNKTIQAELRAAAANSGQNVANTVRQRMADILIKPKEQRGFTPTELGMMERIVRGSPAQNAMRSAGNVLGGGGGLGSVAAGFAGSVAAGPVGALAPVGGFFLKAISNKMTLKQADKLSEAIRSRAPLASSLQKFEEKAAELAAGRTPKSVAAVALAARNFATNLKDSGLNISTSDLMGGLQLGGVGRAEDEQN
jgi:hypothetical protein